MRIGLSRLHAPVTTLGPGDRIGIWLQGCSIHCPGCVSRDTWPVASESQQVEIADIASWCEPFSSRVSGITISGGEPLDQAMATVELLQTLRSNAYLGGCDILLYTGYRFEHARANYPEIFELIDAAVTEPYISSKPTKKVWRGSENQRLLTFSQLGDERYGDSLERLEKEPGLQISGAGGTLWAIGVPRRGMPRFKREMAQKGVDLQECSWQA